MQTTLHTIIRNIFPIICWLFCAITSSKLAYKKNRDTQHWFFLGLFFGVIALIIISFLKPLKNIKKNNQKISIPTSDHFAVLRKDNNYWYYLDAKNIQIGPMSLKKLYDIYLQGKISNYSLVWNDTMDSWKKLIDISSLSKILKKTTN